MKNILFVCVLLCSCNSFKKSKKTEVPKTCDVIIDQSKINVSVRTMKIKMR